MLEARGIDVRFGGVHALKGIDLTVRAGRVLALLGENGAGKSTLINCMAGAVTATDGGFSSDGRPVDIPNPAAASRLGISVIHQELELAPALSVAENLLLGRLPRRRLGLVHRKQVRQLAELALQDIAGHIRWDDRLAGLEVADQQLVEIARAMAHGGTRLLVMDEPTAALPPAQIERLLVLVRRIAAQGVAVVYVSHRIDEVLAIADDISVLREGRLVRQALRKDVTRSSLIRDIVGHIPENVARTAVAPSRQPTVTLKGFGVGHVEDVHATVSAGEVVGFFGLLGAGQQVLAEGLFGLRSDTSGGVEMSGSDKAPRSPKAAIACGLGFVPADRKEEGLALGLSLTENYLLGRPDRGRLGMINPPREGRRADSALREAGVTMRSTAQQAQQLSGGNQQKIVLARWMRRDDIRALLLTEPTRGVDIGAKSEIHRSLRAWAAAPERGRCVVLFSADPEETAAICDRVYVMARGRIVAQLHSSDITEAALTAAALEGLQNATDLPNGTH